MANQGTSTEVQAAIAAVNENFIVAADVGKALDRRDGDLGVYVGIGYLF